MFFFKKFFFLFLVLLVVFVPFYSNSEPVSGEKIFPCDVIYSDITGLRVILVDKKTQKLYLTENKGDFFELITEFNCSTGKNKGDKKVEGDSKTPEGVYLITGHYTKQYLTPVYGTRALTLDYPNYLDKAEGKNGYNIWIHGTDKEPLEQRSTNGCVALLNKDIDVLSDYVEVNKTPVIISEKIEFYNSEAEYKKIKEKFYELFTLWLKSIEAGTYHDYLNFYSSDFLPDISWWTKWQNLRKNFNYFRLSKDSLNVFRESNNVYTLWINFYLDLDQAKSRVLKRKLFIKFENDKPEIIGDIYLDKSQDILTAAMEVKNKSMFSQDVKELIKTWASAWSSKDIELYGRFYSSDFFSEGMNKKSWLRYKDKLNKKYDYIKIDIKSPKIEKKEGIFKLSFFKITSQVDSVQKESKL